MLKITIEKNQDILWGSTNYEGNLVVDSAISEGELIKKIKALLHAFEGIEQSKIDFEIIRI